MKKKKSGNNLPTRDQAKAENVTLCSEPEYGNGGIGIVIRYYFYDGDTSPVLCKEPTARGNGRPFRDMPKRPGRGC